MPGKMFTYKGTPSATLSDKRFKSADAAAAWAASIFMPLSIDDDREFMGAVFHDPDTKEYYVTYNPGDKGKGQVVAARANPAHELSAYWHTHGQPVDQHEYMSTDDVRTTRKDGVPIYLSDGEGRFSKYDPKTSGKSRKHLAPAVQNAAGQDIQLRTQREQPLFAPDTPIATADTGLLKQ